MNEPSAIDIVLRNVIEREVGPRVDAVVASVQAEAQRRIDIALASLQPVPIPSHSVEFGDPFAWIKAQAKSRALRTLVQGVVSALVIAFLTALAQAVADPGFDITDASDWKIALGLGLGAIGTAIASLIQNKLAINPPKV